MHVGLKIAYIPKCGTYAPPAQELFPKVRTNLNLEALPIRLLMTFLVVALACGSAQAEDCWIHGTIEDESGAGIPSARPVNLESGARILTLAVDEYGKFNAEVPCGQYRITTSIINFYPYKRASVLLTGKKHYFLVLRPVPGPPILDGVHPIAYPKIEHEVRYTSFFPTGVGGQEAVIRYNDSHVRDGPVAFLGERSTLMLTFDFLTVYADEISCQPSKFTCIAKGKVLVEETNNQQLEQLEGSSVEIDLLHRKLNLDRDPELERKF